MAYLVACAAPTLPQDAPDAAPPSHAADAAPDAPAAGCGACPAPYRCGAQDLGWYRPEPGVCGLGCRVVASPSPRCRATSPIEHVCPYAPEVAGLIAGDWPYACQLIPGGGQTELHFCCAL